MSRAAILYQNGSLRRPECDVISRDTTTRSSSLDDGVTFATLVAKKVSSCSMDLSVGLEAAGEVARGLLRF